MKKFSRSLILPIILALTACNRPLPTQPPIDIPVTQDLVEDTDLPDETTEIPPTKEDAEPTAEDPTPQPLPPTEDASLDLPEERLPLLSAGTEVTMREAAMLDSSTGWGVAFANGGVGHVLRTEDGGITWRDITPPEPLSPSSSWLYPIVDFIDQDHGYAAFPGSDLIWSTVNGGQSWRPSRLVYATLGGGLITSYGSEHAWFFQFLDAGMQKVYTALYTTGNGGQSWEMLLDPTTVSDHSIQGFDKTGADFHDPDNGVLTRFFRGVTPFVNLDRTEDGGTTWYPLEVSPPLSAQDVFNSCACGYYNPDFSSAQTGTVKLACQCFQEGESYTKNYLYSTLNGGENWEVKSIPEGQLIKISPQVYYVIGREIYKSTDAGDNWDLVKTVNWDGQFSFGDENTALGIAYDPDDDEYALVKTTDGCQTFQILEPQLIPPYSTR